MAVLKSLYVEFISILFLLSSRHLTSFARNNRFAKIDHQRHILKVKDNHILLRINQLKMDQFRFKLNIK